MWRGELSFKKETTKFLSLLTPCFSPGAIPGFLPCLRMRFSQCYCQGGAGKRVAKAPRAATSQPRKSSRPSCRSLRLTTPEMLNPPLQVLCLYSLAQGLPGAFIWLLLLSLCALTLQWLKSCRLGLGSSHCRVLGLGLIFISYVLASYLRSVSSISTNTA